MSKGEDQSAEDLHITWCVSGLEKGVVSGYLRPSVGWLPESRSDPFPIMRLCLLSKTIICVHEPLRLLWRKDPCVTDLPFPLSTYSPKTWLRWNIDYRFSGWRNLKELHSAPVGRHPGGWVRLTLKNSRAGNVAQWIEHWGKPWVPFSSTEKRERKTNKQTLSKI